jgi:4-amino-4-deoxy-L-arabinose transferase-like glycosyltransferase
MSVQDPAARGRPAAWAWPAALRSPLLLVAGITLVAAALRLDRIGAAHTNPFYDAAVRSMGNSWHDFFFGAFEPGGSVSVDKPPLDLWLQVGSSKLFGFNSPALILPQALAATAAVPLLYDLVRRVFGSAAGIAAAAALAVAPVSVITSRSDTMDSLMMALSVLAAWLVVRAIERKQARWLFAAAAVAGLNFDVKLLEALAAIPALVLLYGLAPPHPLGRRIQHLATAAPVFLVAALWWPVAASLASGHKPFPIGSTNGSVWNVIFVYNGLDRVRTAHAVSLPAAIAPGPRRLFETDASLYGRFVGVELLAALVLGALALLVLARRTPSADPLKRAFVVFLAAWLLPSMLLFSKVSVLHLRYLEAITPPIAAIIGIALTSLTVAAATRRLAAVALVAGLAVVAMYASTVPSRDSADHLITSLAAGAAALAVAAALARGGRARPLTAAAGVLVLVALLAGPTAKSAIVADKGQTDSGRPGYMPPDQVARLARYLGPRTRGDRYEVATAFYATAGPLIARDDRPVLVLGNINNRPLVRVAALADAVRRGQVHFILMVGACGREPLRATGRCPRAWRWARTHSVDVSKQAGLSTRGLLLRFTGGG